MATSKFAKAHEKITESVASSFQKISGAVVGGYTKIEDKFAGRYLTKEGETIAQAKERLKQEQKSPEKDNKAYK